MRINDERNAVSDRAFERLVWKSYNLSLVIHTQEDCAIATAAVEVTLLIGI